MRDGKDNRDLSALATAGSTAGGFDAKLSTEDKANLVELIKNMLQGLAAQHMDVLESWSPRSGSRSRRSQRSRCILREHQDKEVGRSIVLAH
ncbi:Nucleosome assembly protein 1-like protein 1 [Hordeum vulgare]|nr:Nucleosome assembly protein 1-like protein 1 [Hordeum vulgare]